jgi:hypothetical protein
VRGIGRSIDHSSTLTIVQTAIRAPSGSGSGLRSTIAEYGTRSGSRTRATRQLRCDEFRRDSGSVGFRLVEVELDLHVVRIHQEKLVQPLVADPAAAERDAERFQVLDGLLQAARAERDVVDDAGAAHFGRLLPT